jgi:hypothetical protein
MSNTLINSLKVAFNEKDVENTYRQFLSTRIPNLVFTSPFGCDGFGEAKSSKIKVLVEFKDDLDMLSKSNQVKVLSQAIYYIKKFEQSGNILPTTVFVGDKNECFVVHVNDLFPYLSMDLDWNIAPSNAHKNMDLVTKMMEDENINPHIFSVDNVDECIEKLLNLTEGVIRLIPITPHNITEVYSYFENNVLGKHNLKTNQLANLFVQLLINPDENYLHPVKKRKTIVTKVFNEVSIKSRESFTSFFSHFSLSYTPKQKEQLTAVVDRLVQDVTRRKQGEFFTPTIWVDKAHEYIASVYGDDWKEKYVVWDPAWGTGNLTRDYKFKELYVSTLIYEDIQTANQMGYNPEATKFQYDFLNDDYEFLPKKLRETIESGKEIIALMNPPYGSVNDFQNIKQDGGQSKNKIEDTIIKIQMNQEQMGLCVKNLYTQFIYRLNKIGNVNICVFSPPLMYSGIDFKIFREKILNKYELKSGFIMNSSQFADVKSWGLTFSILKVKK